MNRTRPLFLVALVGLLALFGGSIAGCSSSSTKATTASSIVNAISAALSSAVAESTAAATTPSSPSASSSASSAEATSLDLSGKWSGQYGGSYQGTFNLNWQQTGASLAGTIAISSPPQTLSLNGTLNGTTITFGTVGSLAITYTGTASASSMSGTYSVGGQNAGSWSASKSS
jgi:hypothetical protein